MITITGTGFGDGATVTFDGLEATDVVVLDQTRITCTPPDHPDGFATIVITNPDGTTGELADTFIYITQSVSPEEGPTTGGTVLTLTISDGGAGIDWFPDDHELVVFVDPGTGTPLEFTRIDNGTLECVTAAQLCGPADVVVTDLADDSTPVFALPGGYTYELPPPTITDIDPTSGPAVGGQLVVLTGSFSCALCSGGGTLAVAIGGVPLTAVVCSSTTIIGKTGLGAAGLSDVVVTNPDGQTVTLSDAYAYVNAPTVTSIDPDAGPAAGSTAVTITGADFQDGASVLLTGLITPDLPEAPDPPPDPPELPFVAVADAFDVVVLDAETITATTGAGVTGLFDVVVTNPDGQRGRLEQGYAYEGWWIGVPDFEPDAELWLYDAEPIPGFHWRREPLLVPPPDGWWMSTAAYGGNVMVVASSRPKDPRRWNQIATFAVGSAAMLGGSPGIAGVFHNRLVYAASDYTVGTTYPPIRIYDGSFDRELCRLPPTTTNTVPVAILSLLVANGTIYLSTFDGGTSSSTWVGRVFALELTTATLTPIGAVFPTGHLPYALAWHNGMLWCGTHRQTTDVAGKVLRIRPDLPDAAWLEETFTVGYNVAALLSWQGMLYAGTTAPAGAFGQILRRDTTAWATAHVGSGGTATANNGYLAFCEFNGALYASFWNADTPAVATIQSTTDGTTWTTRYTGAGGTARPFIALTVDKGELFAIGGGAHLTVAILRTPDGTTWTDLTAELPDPEKTALPAVGALVF